MSYQIYKLMHMLGIFLLFLSLGGVALFTINGGTKSTNKWKSIAAITHGLALVLLLVAGFGMMARLGIPHGSWPGWVYAKIVVWLTFGGLLAVVYRKPAIAKVLWVGFPLLGVCAAYLAIYKPF
ncbi:hypothetical protein [Leptospira idonii]|uniref:Invasion protein n=1 Tax=Leptospira idonii TaxID=1193500 RepID=A0A4R9M1G6_9LEPT|nr:hypothetical protein [Leptospira idonii]TGN19811.1 hypothetical protein EHS15_06840 [Leptospira idonii]